MKTVNIINCGECPKRAINADKLYTCYETRIHVPLWNGIPDHCPLPDVETSQPDDSAEPLLCPECGGIMDLQEYCRHDVTCGYVRVH